MKDLGNHKLDRVLGMLKKGHIKPVANHLVFEDRTTPGTIYMLTTPALFDMALLVVIDKSGDFDGDLIVKSLNGINLSSGTLTIEHLRGFETLNIGEVLNPQPWQAFESSDLE